MSSTEAVPDSGLKTPRWQIVTEEGVRSIPTEMLPRSVNKGRVMEYLKHDNYEPDPALLRAVDSIRPSEVDRKIAGSPLPYWTATEIEAAKADLGIDMANSLDGWGLSPRQSAAMPQSDYSLADELSSDTQLGDMPIPAVAMQQIEKKQREQEQSKPKKPARRLPSACTVHQRPVEPKHEKHDESADYPQIYSIDPETHVSEPVCLTSSDATHQQRFVVVDIEHDQFDNNLAHVIRAWPNLHADLRKAVVSIIESSER